MIQRFGQLLIYDPDPLTLHSHTRNDDAPSSILTVGKYRRRCIARSCLSIQRKIINIRRFRFPR